MIPHLRTRIPRLQARAPGSHAKPRPSAGIHPLEPGPRDAATRGRGSHVTGTAIAQPEDCDHWSEDMRRWTPSLSDR